MNTIRISFLSFIICFASAYAIAQQAYLVKDISTTTVSSDPDLLTKSNSLVFFVADDEINGPQLWRTDGTESGTIMLTNLPGIFGNNTDDSYLTDVNNTLFFTADDSEGEESLWTSDGTILGTQVISTIENSAYFDDPMVNINGTLFLSPSHRELWTSDGTLSGTVLVKDQIGTAGVSPDKFLTNVDGTLFFVGYDATHGYELWKSDGTFGGTVMVKDINPGTNTLIGSTMYRDPQFTNVNGTLYFSADNGVDGIEMWKSDGTEAGTMLVKDINPAGNSISKGYTYFNNEIYFSTYSNDTVSLWKTDGTEVGTEEIISIQGYQPDLSSEYFTEFNNLLYFSITTGNDFVNSGLWSTDGTAIGTSLIFKGYTNDLEIVGDDMYLSFSDSASTYIEPNIMMYDHKLWKGDGTENSFQMIKDLGAHDLTELNGNLIFAANENQHGDEIWISDGTPDGTQLVKDVNNTSDSYIRQLTDVNGVLFFSADDDIHGGELWTSNGQTIGTNMVVDANPNGNSNPYYITSFNNHAYYRGYDGDASELWKSDGTEAGSGVATDTFYSLSNIKAYDDMMLIKSNSVVWKTDGTGGGSVNLDILHADEYLKINDDVFAYNYIGYLEKVNLTSLEKTQLLSSGEIRQIFNFRDTLFFINMEEVYDTIWFDETDYFLNWNYEYSVWMSDGSIIGTKKLHEMYTYSYLATDSVLYLSARKDGVSGLYHTKSPVDSMGLIKSFPYGTCNNLIESNGELFFTVNDNVNGIELWKSNGTEAGTVLVKDINPTGNSSPSDLVSYDGVLYFAADDGTNGVELWKSDGTENGTVMVADINPIRGSDPTNITVSSNRIYFIANDGTTGKELWTYSPYSTISSISDSVCFEYLSPSEKYTWTESNAYLDTIPASNGNDSIITVYLTVHNIETTVTETGSLLKADAVNATYQWLDCDDSYSIVDDATDQSFIPLANGNYAVEVKKEGCTDQSSCYSFLTVAIENDVPIMTAINARNNSIEIKGKGTATIYNLTGQRVHQSILTGNTSISLNQKGIYLVRVIDEGRSVTEKVYLH